MGMKRSTPYLIVTGLFLVASVGVVYFLLGGGNLFGNKTSGSSEIHNEKKRETTINEEIPESTSSTEMTAYIEGSLGFPSEVIPESMRVCAENVSTGELFCTEEHLEGNDYKYGLGYRLPVRSGTYYVYSILPGDGVEWMGYKAYFDEFVVCGLSVDCTDHTPIAITARGGETTLDIDPIDWYNKSAPDGEGASSDSDSAEVDTEGVPEP